MAKIRFTSKIQSKSLLSGILRDRMKRKGAYNDYEILVYYEGKYPKTKYRDSSVPVSEVARTLQTGVLDSNGQHIRIEGDPNKRGRRENKKWEFEKRTRSTHLRKWKSKIRESVKGILTKGKGSKSLYANLVSLGSVMRKDFQNTIIGMTSPELSESTIGIRKKKLSEGKPLVNGLYKPLIETGRLLNSIKVRVIKTSTYRADQLKSPSRRTYIEQPRTNVMHYEHDVSRFGKENLE